MADDERAAAGEQADAQQGALGARGKIPHRQDLPARGAAPAAGPASDEGLADARSRPDAEHFARALAARCLRRGRKSDVLGFCAVHRAAADASSSPTSIASPHGRATTISGRGLRPAICSMPAGRATRRGSWCCIRMTATPPIWRWRISPPRTPCSPIAGRAAAGAGAWRPGAAGGAASLFLEERQMAAEHRIPRRGCAGLLGSPRLSQPRRSVGRNSDIPAIKAATLTRENARAD